MSGKVRARDQWMLFLLTSIFMIGELGHFLIGVVSRSIAQELHYGDQSCLPRPNVADVPSKLCDDANSSTTCELIMVRPTEFGCEWNYNGLGIEYQYLAGPSFIVAFTIAGIFWGVAADSFNRVILVSLGTLLFSIGITVTAFATKYWHLILLRTLLAIGESAITPLGAGMITDVFPEKHRAVAMGLFTWGIYIGYGFSYTVGNYVTEANILDYSWRPCFIISGIPGLVLCALFLLTVNDPPKGVQQVNESTAIEPKEEKYGVAAEVDSPTKRSIVPDIVEDELSPSAPPFEEKSYWATWYSCISPALILLIIAACIRHTAGFTWGYNSALYFQEYYPEYNAAWWLTCISIFGGAAGALIGGYIADRFVPNLGISSRVLVLAGSQFLATPFTIGLLYFDPPLAFFSLLIGYFVAEMWYGVLFIIIVEIVPFRLRSTVVAITSFIINNVGGNLPVLVAVISDRLNLRAAITIFYPGALFTSAVLFFLCWFLLRGRKSG